MTSSATATDRPIVPPARRWRWGGYVLLLVVLGGGLVAFDGARRQSAGAAATPLSDPPGPTAAGVNTPATRLASDPRRLRLATFNIASGRGTDGVQDLRRTADAVRRAFPLDLVALHEVRGYYSGVPSNQAEELAGRLTYRWAFVPTERRWWHDDFGNALLVADAALGPVTRIPLPQTQERGHRNVAVVRVPFDGAVVTVLSTHVDRRVDQPAQLRFLAELFRSVPAPAVLMGDLNVPRAHPILRDLVDTDGAVDATLGFEDTSRPNQIELIFTRGLRPVAAGKVEIGASDHPLVWAELELKR